MINHFPAKADPEEVKDANKENEWLQALDPETGEPPVMQQKRKPKLPAWRQSSRQRNALKRG